jgi:3'-5' exoribonuclease
MSFLTKGQFIQLKARVGSFQGKKQLTFQSCSRIAPEDVPWEFFREDLPEDQSRVWGELLSILNKVEASHWKAFLQEIWKEPDLERRFKTYPAAKSVHHGRICGLMRHCLSMLKISDGLCDHYQRYNLNRDIVLVGVLMHDIGKCYELQYDFRTEYTLEGQLLGHIVLGSELADRICRKVHVPEHERIQLKHIILSHHGAFEFGSPKVPQTLEAFLVHHVDLLDSKMETFSDHLRDQGTNDDGWTSFNRFLDRNLYAAQMNRNFFSSQETNSSKLNQNELADVLKRANEKLNEIK